MPKTKHIPKSVMLQSLTGTSHLASQVWRRIEQIESEAERTEALAELWELQENLEALIDAHAELVQALDAQIVSLKTRRQYLIEVHDAEIRKLVDLRQRMDETVLRLNERGKLGDRSLGQVHQINVCNNPPGVDEIDMTHLPDEFKLTKTVVEVKPDKKAILSAWKSGIPVPGATVCRKRRVEYRLSSPKL